MKKSSRINSLLLSLMMLGLSACSFSEPTHDERAEWNTLDSFAVASAVPAPAKKATAKDIKIAKNTKKKKSIGDGSYEVASVSDDTLSGMRGGFISVNGLKINFGLFTSTLINNNPVTNMTLSTQGLNGNLPTNLQQLLQTGDNNQALVNNASMPINVMTVVQNTVNNQVIQNTNVLDITVSNLQAFRDQQISLAARFNPGLAR